MKKFIISMLSSLVLVMSYGSPIKSSLSVRETGFAKSGTKVTAKDYIQDGLVAMWDAQENIGWGKHDDTATTWVDLTGNGHNWINIKSSAWVNGNARTVNGNGNLEMMVPLTNSVDISTLSICCEHLQTLYYGHVGVIGAVKKE